MCRIWQLPLRRPDLLGEDMDRATIERLASDAAELGVKTVTLSGGEPMLRPDVCDLIRHFRSLGMASMVFTNAVLLADVDLAHSLVDACPDRIVVSLDSPSPDFHDHIRGVKGFWEGAVSGIRNIVRERDAAGSDMPRVSIFSLVSHRNLHDSPQMRQLARELGAEEVIFNPLIDKVPGALDDYRLTDEDITWANEHDIALPTSDQNAYYTRNLCFAPFVQMTVDPFGNVYPCCFACSFQNLDKDLDGAFWDGEDQFNMGNVTEERLTSIWRGERFSTFRRSMRHTPTFGMCRQCNQSPAQPWDRLQPFFRTVAALDAASVWKHQPGGNLQVTGISRTEGSAEKP